MLDWLLSFFLWLPLLFVSVTLHKTPPFNLLFDLCRATNQLWDSSSIFPRFSFKPQVRKKKKINLSTWQRPESGVIPICVNVILPETQFNITFFFPRNDLLWIYSFELIWNSEPVNMQVPPSSLMHYSWSSHGWSWSPITLRCAHIKWDRRCTNHFISTFKSNQVCYVIDGAAKVGW